MHYVIVGGCAAGLNAVEGIREVDDDGEITLISAEPYLPYARCLITNFLAGTHTQQDLILQQKEYFEKKKVHVLNGEPVTEISYPEKKVKTSSGKRFSYDRLLLATGSKPKSLGIAGEEKEGVYHFWTLEDARKISERATRCQQALIFGGGLVGIKAACALKKRGIDVQLLVKSGQILSQLVNPEAATLIAACLQANGIKIRTGVGPQEIIGNKEMTGARLDNGETVPAQIAIIGKGVSPEKKLACHEKINCQHGIIVDEYLQTGLSDVFAAGDVAETKDFITGEPAVHGLWLTAQEQGRIAGLNMAAARKKYPGSLAANATEFFGLPLVTVGIIRPEKSDQIIEWQDKETWHYHRFILRNDTLVGFVMIAGQEINHAGFYTALIRSRVNLKNYRHLLGKDYFDYADLREKIEKHTGFRESVSPEGKQIFFI